MTVTEQHPFLDADSALQLQWSAIWQKFSPVTPFGQRRKSAIVPLGPGDEAAYERVSTQLRDDAERLDEAAGAAFAGRLQVIPDIGHALSALAQPGVVLSIKQLLAVKQFLYYGDALARDSAQSATPLEWTNEARWQRVLDLFGQTDVPSFAIHHIADEPWHAASHAVAQAGQAQAQVVRDRDRLWVAEVGVRPTRDGQLVLRLPAAHALAQQLHHDERVNWLRDTPFESVFQIAATSNFSACTEELDDCKARLEAAEASLVHHFCAALRASLPDLWRLAEDVADLDLRVAKVRLLHEWGGCVPTLANAVRLSGGVHPLVAQRLRNASPSAPQSAYVPLDFDPDLGPNVLCGANMGGKTVALSLLCLCQVLAQHGLPVPAQSFATRLCRFVRFCGGADTDLDNGLSAYGREITQLNRVWTLWKESGEGLICLDEPARSTNPVEGEALVVALLRQIRSQPRDSVWVVATHLAGAVAQPGVTKFRVRGLSGQALTDLPPPPKETPRAGTPDSAPPPLTPSPATSPLATQPRAAASEADRIAWLAQAMDYRIVRMDDATPPAEALRVAAWLGLSADIIDESRRYLWEGKSS